MNENYMDQFSSPEEFIRAEVLANRGTQSIATKDDLILAIEEAKYIPGKDYSQLTKAQLFDSLVELVGDKAYTMFPVGVSSFSFQLKYGIEHKDVLKLAKGGVITVTGEKRFRKYGKYLYAKTYSPFDYFRLTPEYIHGWLAEHTRKRKCSDNPTPPLP